MIPARLADPPAPVRIGGAWLPMVGRVRMYVCGITPYDVTHLGHAATYVWADVADRVLRAAGHRVVLARNVTDVDEVLFAEARRRGERHDMLATLQRASFEATMDRLRVRVPDHSPTAAQAVGHVVQLAAALLVRGVGYLADGTVYARTAPVADRLGLDGAQALALAAEYRDHPDDPAKEHPLDVAVWRRIDDGDAAAGVWPSPWGPGRPGWHAECAAMVLALFGPSVDLHCGGADLAFPHHACESALAEGATGVRPFARAWLRAGTVQVDGAKMAKSAGNLVLVDDLLREHSAAAIRLLCLNRPWHEPWTYTPQALADATDTLQRLYSAAARPGGDPAGAPVLDALRDELDVPRALSIALAEGGGAARRFVELLALG